MKPNIVLLGGGGFIGTSLHQHFLKNNINSISLSRSFQKKLPHQVQTNALSYDNIEKFLNKETISIDLLNTISSADTQKHISLIKKIGNSKANKIIFFSSAAVYGNNLSITTENSKLGAFSDYGKSKIKLEKTIQKLSKPYLIFRLSNCYGPQQYPKNNQIIPHFFDSVLKQTSPVINNQGNQIRDFIYIDDVVNIVNKTIIKEQGVFNLSTNIGTTINNLWQNIVDITKTNFKPTFIQNNIKEINFSILDNTKLVKLTNYQFTTLDIGLKRTFDWFKNNIKV